MPIKTHDKLASVRMPKLNGDVPGCDAALKQHRGGAVPKFVEVQARTVRQ
jgi:hypothetical protein